MEEKQMEKVLKDLTVIKNLLKDKGVELFKIWRNFFIASGTVLVLSLLQYFVPVLRNLGFTEKFLFLWCPVVAILVLLAYTMVIREAKKTGRVVAVGRIRHVLFQRNILFPILLFFLFLTEKYYPVEGLILLCVACFQSIGGLVMPPPFRGIPYAFLTLGAIEFIFSLSGPEIALLNGLIVAITLFFVALLIKSTELRGQRERETSD